MNATFVIAVLLVIHGVISLMQGLGGGAPVANPTWLAWWPTDLGESWLPSASLVQSIGRMLWLASGVAILAAGLSLLGVVLPRETWRTLATVGAALAVPVLLAEIHPFYLPVTLLNVGVVVGLVWLRWPSISAIGA